MIKFLGTISTKKLDLKHEPKQRRVAFLEWVGCLEVAFSNYKYTRRILTDYSTSHKIHNVKNDAINRLVYSVCYAFMVKTVRTSASMYKDNGIALLKALHIKCASIDSKTRDRAKQAFLQCRIAQDETSIGFLSRLERKASEARNYDVKISETKFIKTLLNNMKHHKYYRNIIAALFTAYELDNDAFNQKWLEHKFYALDEERLLNFKGRINRYEARLVQPYQNNKDRHKKFRNTRCKYCYRPGRIDPECRDKENERPPSVVDWVSKIQCSKNKKTGHLAFNCPPKFNNIKRKSPKENRYNKYN